MKIISSLAFPDRLKFADFLGGNVNKIPHVLQLLCISKIQKGTIYRSLSSQQTTNTILRKKANSFLTFVTIILDAPVVLSSDSDAPPPSKKEKKVTKKKTAPKEKKPPKEKKAPKPKATKSVSAKVS